MEPAEDCPGPFKFDVYSWKEGILDILCLLTFSAISFGFVTAASNGLINIIYAGGAFFLFLLVLRLTTDDHIIIDYSKNSLLFHNRFLFFKKISYYCAITDIKKVILHTEIRVNKNVTYTNISLRLKLPKGVERIAANSITIRRIGEYQFDKRVAKLRNNALEIARYAGCKLSYGDKIPPEERVRARPKNWRKKISRANKKKRLEDKKKLKKKKEISKIELMTASPVIESDFLQDVGERICSSCGGNNPEVNIFCIHCANKISPDC